MQYSHRNTNGYKIPVPHPAKDCELSLLYNSKKHNCLITGHGFTLVEVMVTIAIAAIAFTIALPSLSGFTTQLRVDNQVSVIQRLLLTTRNAAINSGQNATLCPLKADNTCEDVNYWTGRIGVVSVDGLIKEREPIQTGDKLDFDFNSVTYAPSGQLNSNNIDIFSYCPQGFSNYSRGVSISLSGRAYISSDINGDGNDQDRNSNNIVCD